MQVSDPSCPCRPRVLRSDGLCLQYKGLSAVFTNVAVVATARSTGVALVATLTVLAISACVGVLRNWGAERDFWGGVENFSRPHLMQNWSPSTDLSPQFPQNMDTSLLLVLAVQAVPV